MLGSREGLAPDVGTRPGVRFYLAPLGIALAVEWVALVLATLSVTLVSVFVAGSTSAQPSGVRLAVITVLGGLGLGIAVGVGAWMGAWLLLRRGVVRSWARTVATVFAVVALLVPFGLTALTGDTSRLQWAAAVVGGVVGALVGSRLATTTVVRGVR